MHKQTILDRLQSVKPEVWLSLNEICETIGTTAKSYVKIQLLACQYFEYKRVLVKQKSGRHVKDTWRWMFRRVE